MAHAWRALIIAPDDFPSEYDNYDAACRALKLEPNGHCYLVCLVSRAAGLRTLLTVDLALLPGIDEAGLPEQASPPGTDRSTEAASGTGSPGLGSDRRGRRERNPFGRFALRSPDPRQSDRPHVQLVLDLDRATLKGVAVWKPGLPGQLGIADKADDEVKAAFREACANTAAQAVLDRFWPPHASPSGLADLDAALTALKAVLEPQTLLLNMINAAARVAAVHAGFGAAAPLVGQFAEELCKPYVRPPTPTDRIILNIVDIDLYAADRKLPDSATLRELTTQEASVGIKQFSALFGVNTPGLDPGILLMRDESEAATMQARNSHDPGDPGSGGPSRVDPRHSGSGGPSRVLSGRQSASMSAVDSYAWPLTASFSRPEWWSPAPV